VDSPGSGYGPLAGCCECGDEPSGSGAKELVAFSLEDGISMFVRNVVTDNQKTARPSNTVDHNLRAHFAVET
jgi:hypothetical protein